MPASDRADRAIEKLERLDADYASRTATSIKAARRKASRLAYGLAALGTTAALLVMGFAWWANRSFAAMAETRARLASVRKRLAERRAEELEIFAGRVAHDLRDPLGAIALHVAVAQRDVGEPVRVQASLVKIITVVEHATQIIQALLDFARAGGVVDPHARVDACAVVRSVLDDLEQEIEESKLSFTTVTPSVAELRCSPGALLSVIGNLVRNAIKFAPGGAVTIRVVDALTTVRVEVEDTGPGLAPGQAERLFEPFVRAAPSGQPGVGLGLATVKRLVEAHDGRVGVHAVDPRGSCFWFELPKPPARSDGATTPFAHAHA